MFMVPKKQDIDPELLQKQKNRAKFRFRALVRSVMANNYWLEESAEVYEGDNVQRRVEQVMKGKHKKKQLLSVADKALLNKPAKDRTEHEKRYIYRVIGGLKCFKRYPNHVKRKLAAVTYFKYYGPKRVIVREDQEAEALYFVVTGEVTVSKLIYDPLLKQYMSINVFVFRPGDMFGEVSLLHNIPRTATCTATGHCEFLALMREDFKNILQGSLQKQWDKVRKAMDSFSYFDGLDSVARRDGCIIAKLKSYEPNETILGDGVEVPNFVYFVLSGRCQMIESLNVEIINDVRKKRYKLHDDYVSPNESEQNLKEKYFQHLNKAKQEKNDSINEQSIQTDSMESEERINAEKTIESEQQKAKSTEHLKSEHKLVRLESKLSDSSSVKLLTSASKKVFDIEEFKPEADDISLYPHHYSRVTTSTDSESMHNFVNAASKAKIQEESESKRSHNPIKEPSVMFALGLPPYKTYFMQVCIMTWGSTFNLGENMRDRRIIAQTRVDCMLLPKMWLMQQNTANVWSRILYYLEKKIPTKQDLFKDFVKQRRWQEYRDSVVEDVVCRSSVVNHTTVHDVPYSIRMDEMLDI